MDEMYDSHFEPEWCERCGATGHCGINCPHDDCEEEEDE